MARVKRRSRGSKQTVVGSMKNLFVGLGSLAIVLTMLLFVMFLIEEYVVRQYIDLTNITGDNYTHKETNCGSACAELRSGFDKGETVVTLGLGLLALIAVVLIFMGFLLPVIQSSL